MPKRENGFHSLLFNILIPVIILTQGDRLIANPASVLVIPWSSRSATSSGITNAGRRSILFPSSDL
jgi:hypothetical protein